MAQWRSKVAVLQDLAEVTRGALPFDIAANITAGAEKPAIHLFEEEDDEYLQHLMADDSESTRQPDLTSLKQLLTMVNEVDEEEIIEEKILVISKLNVYAPEFNMNTSTSSNKPIMKEKKKKQNNVAIESILAAKDAKTIAEAKLMEPEDLKLITKNHVYHNPLPGASTLATKKGEQKGLILSSTSMFKKKTLTKNPEKKVTTPTTPNSFIKQFDPSALGAEVYESLLNSAKKKEIESRAAPETERQNVWSQVMLEIKRLDEERLDKEKAIEQLLALNLKAFQHGVDLNRIASIGLRQHRHDLNEKCVVCEKLCLPRGPRANNDPNCDNSQVALSAPTSSSCSGTDLGSTADSAPDFRL